MLFDKVSRDNFGKSLRMQNPNQIQISDTPIHKAKLSMPCLLTTPHIQWNSVNTYSA